MFLSSFPDVTTLRQKSAVAMPKAVLPRLRLWRGKTSDANKPRPEKKDRIQAITTMAQNPVTQGRQQLYPNSVWGLEKGAVLV